MVILPGQREQGKNDKLVLIFWKEYFYSNKHVQRESVKVNGGLGESEGLFKGF